MTYKPKDRNIGHHTKVIHVHPEKGLEKHCKNRGFVGLFGVPGGRKKWYPLVMTNIAMV